MSYNFDNQQLQRQIEDMQRQYRQYITQPQQSLPPLIPPAPPVIPHQIQYVEGLAGARLYQESLAPNASEVIMDKDEDIFYKVSKDANGIAAKKIPMASFTILEPQEDTESLYVTKKDLNDLKEELLSFFRQPEKKVNQIKQQEKIEK